MTQDYRTKEEYKFRFNLANWYASSKHLERDAYTPQVRDTLPKWNALFIQTLNRLGIVFSDVPEDGVERYGKAGSWCAPHPHPDDPDNRWDPTQTYLVWAPLPVESFTDNEIRKEFGSGSFTRVTFDQNTGLPDISDGAVEINKNIALLSTRQIQMLNFLMTRNN